VDKLFDATPIYDRTKCAREPDLAGGQLPLEAAQAIIEEDLAPALPGKRTNDCGAHATTEMNHWWPCYFPTELG
jgi:hypothetical protein